MPHGRPGRPCRGAPLRGAPHGRPHVRLVRPRAGRLSLRLHATIGAPAVVVAAAGAQVRADPVQRDGATDHDHDHDHDLDLSRTEYAGNGVPEHEAGAALARPVAAPRVAAPGPVGAASLAPAGRGPSSALAGAAAVAVVDLHGRLGLDLWLVTRLVQDRQVVLAAAGPWTQLASPGLALPWAQSFCRQMVRGAAPVAVGDVARSPDYQPIAVGAYAPVRAYLGVPVLLGGQLFGTVCAFGGQPQPALPAVLQQVVAVGQLLSVIIGAEQRADDSAREALRVSELAELDALTGVRNRRGWDTALAAEQHRCQRYGLAVSVLVVDLDGLKGLNDQDGHTAGDAVLSACGRVLREACRPGDVVARTGGDEFAVLAVQCDALSALALLRRVRLQLRTAGIAASVGAATHRPQETLSGTWARADHAMYRRKRTRSRPTPP